jgi:aldehyde dehydrogenase (NAD+)
MEDQRTKPITIAHLDKLFIGGEWVAPTTADRVALVDPTTEEVYAHVAEGREADIDKAVVAAVKAFRQGPWPKMSPAERAVFLGRIADGMEARIEDLKRAWVREMGGLHSVSGMMVQAAIGAYRYYANLASSFEFIEKHKPSDGMGGAGYLVREPVGVVGAIVPWNGPQSLAAQKVAPALLAGCTIILKPSPEAPLDAYILAEVAEAAGLPPGVLNVITADRAASEHLVRQADVNKISFTGSLAAGKQIASACGERIARVTLELGGKSPAIILDDYDPAAMAAALTPGICFMTGQVCATLSRILVPRSRQADYVDALAACFAQVVTGDPFDPASGMGPLAMQRQRDRVEMYIGKGQAEGARLVAGGRRPRGLNRGYFIEPTLFADVDNDMMIAREEIFGPVLSVIAYDDVDHAVEIANDSWAGLNANIFTNDADRAYGVARRLLSGTVGHNGFRVDTNIAFGGFKQSGLGREGGREGLMPYLESKTILLDRSPSIFKA